MRRHILKSEGDTQYNLNTSTTPKYTNNIAIAFIVFYLFSLSTYLF